MPEKREKHKSKNGDVTIRPKEDCNGSLDTDRLLWESFVQDVVPLRHKSFSPPPDSRFLAEPVSRKKHSYKPFIPEIVLRDTSPDPMQQIPCPLDRGMDQKFRKGLLPIDGRLDLHGHSVDVAFRVFLEFMARHSAVNSRCLLVITGKGLDHATGIESGAIRSEFPKWLGLPRFSGLVLSYCTAPAHMGGRGAYLVLLRKRKTTSKG